MENDSVIYSVKTKNRFEALKNMDPQNPDQKITNQNNYKKTKINGLKTLVINFQSLKNKIPAFRHMVSDEQSDIIIGTETWLNKDITNAELDLGEYEIFRKDRVNRKGGGVLLAVKKDLKSEEIKVSNRDDTETVYCKIKLNNNTLIVGSVYRPPNSNADVSHKITQQLHEIHNQNKNALFWIAGDFNLPDVDWDTNSSHCTNPINTQVIDTMDTLGWKQIVKEKTHKNNILDLFFTNNPGLITKNHTISGLGDHHAVVITSRIKPKRSKKPPRKIFIWKKCNLEEMRKDMENYEKEFSSKFDKDQDVNEMWLDIKTNILTTMQKHVPSKTTTRNFQKPWFNSKTKKITRKKKKWFKKMKQSKSEKVKQKYNEIKRECQKTCRETHASYVNSMIEEDKDNKKLWSYIKSKNNEESGIPDLVDKNDKITQDPTEKANLLNSQFASVFSNPNPEIQTPNEEQHPEMKKIKVTRNGVYKLLTNINENKATGPDNIPGKFLKMLAPEMSNIYTKLFQTSLDQGKVPDDWKTAKIMPIFKKGQKSNPSNYRPVSLTSITCKLLEHIIHSNIMDHFENHKILNNIQHGFRQKRSCESQLITTIDDFSNCLNNKSQTDSILLDFSKAFDKVDHKGLLNKMKSCGVSKEICKWSQSFLIGRTQTVIVDGHESNKISVESGVPQGTVLGPLYFLIYINDINQNLTPGTKIRLFADDSFLYREIKSENDCKTLQEDLNTLQKWEKTWKMEFHPEKCQLLKITNKTKPINFNYYIHGKQLQETKQAKYLGVVIDSKLQWTEQNKTVTKKQTQFLASLKETPVVAQKTSKQNATMH